MFKFRSGTNGLNEELGRQRGTNEDRQCKLCGEECESVVCTVLWECPVYDTIRNSFMGDRRFLGVSFEEFSALNITNFVLGCENWDRSNFMALLSLVKNFILSVWDAKKTESYGSQDGET